MEPSDKMDTSEPHSLQNRIIRAELPDDDQIKEAIQERQQIAMSNETDSDNCTSSDCDSDVEGMENLWDTLFRTAEPYENSIEQLKKLLDLLPRRLSTREHKLYLKYGPENYDAKHFDRMNNILNSRLVDPDIDQDILMENLERMRGRIKSIIKRKEKAAQKLKQQVDVKKKPNTPQ